MQRQVCVDVAEDFDLGFAAQNVGFVAAADVGVDVGVGVGVGVGVEVEVEVDAGVVELGLLFVLECFVQLQS